MTCFLLRLQLCTCLTNRVLRQKWSLTRTHGGFLLIQAPANVNACCLTPRQMNPFMVLGVCSFISDTFADILIFWFPSSGLWSQAWSPAASWRSTSISTGGTTSTRTGTESRRMTGDGRAERSVRRQVSRNVHLSTNRTRRTGEHLECDVTWVPSPGPKRTWSASRTGPISPSDFVSYRSTSRTQASGSVKRLKQNSIH